MLAIGSNRSHSGTGPDGLRLPGAPCRTRTSAGLTGPVGRILISPAYHRIHHTPTGRLDINLGTVFPFWDMLSGRAAFPAGGSKRDASPTGLAGRPVPVEQSARRGRLGRTMLSQLAEPFTSTRTEIR